MNNENALITKIIDTRDIAKIIDSKVSKAFLQYPEVWEFVEDYYLKYKQLPTFEVLEQKHPDFTPEHVTTSLDYLIDEVNNTYLEAKLEDMISRAVGIMDSDSPREALNYIFSKSSALGHQTDVLKDVDLAEDYWVRLASLRARVQAASEGNEMLGIPSLFPPIDVLFGGWQPGDFIVMMGWTGMGKTHLASRLALNAWLSGKVPLYFSLEMDDKQFGYRIDTMLGDGEFSSTSLINGRHISPDHYEVWAKENYEDKQPFYVVTNEGLDEVTQNTVQQKIEQYKPDIVFLDYHSLFDDSKKGRSETERHKNLSKDFKRLAVQYGVPIVDVVAVTMGEGHMDRPPELNEVAWSKQLAYDADLVLSLVKSSQMMTVAAKKSRRSDLFAFDVLWDFDKGKAFYQEI